MKKEGIIVEKLSQEQIIKNKLIAYGYNPKILCISLDENLRNMSLDLSMIYNDDKIQESKCSKDKVKLYAKDFFEKRFKLHNIFYISEQEYRKIMKKHDINYSKLNNLDKFQKELSQKKEIISPYDLPIIYTGENSIYSEISKSIFLPSNDEYLNKIEIYFSDIQLGGNITTTTPVYYVHELTHSQLESVKGSILDYKNRELLPIFLELLAALSFDSTRNLFRKIQITRLIDLRRQIALLYLCQFNNLAKLEPSIYVSSTLKALNLLDIYLNGNENLKKEILNDIQNIFDGKYPLEILLDKHNITLENSKDIQLVKKYI